MYLLNLRKYKYRIVIYFRQSNSSADFMVAKQYLEELNRQFDDYVNNNPEKSTSELAKDFTANNIDEQELFQEMKRLFEYGKLTIMERKSNVSKNNCFSYCSVDEWSNCPHFRKRHEELFK